MNSSLTGKSWKDETVDELVTRYAEITAKQRERLKMAEEHGPTIIKDFPGEAVERQYRTTGALPGETCYTTMEPGHMLAALSDDGLKWATAFNQHAIVLGYKAMDVNWLTGWFANAIEHSSDVRRWRKEGFGRTVSLDS